MNRQFSAPALMNSKRNVTLYMEGSSRFAPSHSFEEVKDETSGEIARVLRVRDMPVFRSGSFKDSLGDLSTWETLHIEQMVSSFAFLRQNNVFPDVPVREGHGSFFGDPMTGLVGYHDALRSQDAVADDGNTYRYLLADFTLYKPEAQQNFLSGLWRNRSSEVGYYESNDGTGYYPVYQGFAFVDIPAVQYLNLFGKEKQRSFSVLLEKEIQMSGSQTSTPPAPPTVNPDGSAAQGENNSQQNNVAPAGTGNPVTPPISLSLNGGMSGGGGGSVIPPTATAHLFTCGGQQVSDYVAVQSYITKLEGELQKHEDFRKETIKTGRINYVRQLATDKKILASQMGDENSGMTAHVLSLTDEQFAAWRKMYDDAPALGIFANQASGGTDPNENEKSADEKEFEQACAQVQWHRAANMLASDLEKTASYKKMTELAKKLGKEAV